MKLVLIMVVATVTLAASKVVAQTNKPGTNVLQRLEKAGNAAVSRSMERPLAILYRPGSPGNGFDSSQGIHYGFSSTANKSSIIYVLRPEYAFRISGASDETGEMLEPTRHGRKFGEKFDQPTGYDRSIIAERKSDPYRKVAVPSWEDPSFAGTIPAPEELFKFPRPGRYTIKIEAACFASREFPRATNFDLVKFPSVTLPVIKR